MSMVQCHPLKTPTITNLHGFRAPENGSENKCNKTNTFTHKYTYKYEHIIHDTK